MMEDEKNESGGSEKVGEKEKEPAMNEVQHMVVHHGGGGGGGPPLIYPTPLATHEEIVKNHVVFMDALRSFHSSMSTKFMIPVIGGKDLDLHQLYVQVTLRGGLEKVILGRKWREVIAVFNFPSTTTSASFVLRKYYLSLLHHFEQVYFFGAKGPLILPAEALQTKSPSGKLERARPSSSETYMASSSRKRVFSEAEKKAAQTLASVSDGGEHSEDRSGPGDRFNFSVSGTIDGKFDYGYFVTVKMNSEILKGVLYHAPPSTSSPHAAPSNKAVVVYSPEQAQRRQKRYRDPAHPKPNRSAYNFFFAQKACPIEGNIQRREREFSKMIGESWNKLSDEERSVYQEISKKDKERYGNEMKEYRARQRIGMPGTARIDPNADTSNADTNPNV
ncbi:LOW QUALITY PROTEIN: high mobility group B protein 9-like [Dioscorea cayenensis subsp. rotundata]|uniref:LOW QUALITY PROTEIN: high mobility group B protein 9-like n=1 Tax=Dioscorea cayennensis subsp. rotundata TaxID=55577 RepID=A0AB40CUD5_DIOCR|nr:LOW QUALITY PROTEIN: high mobility group B protein 9-like [Dioscorea cayenensis subsp. rotundata]